MKKYYIGLLALGILTFGLTTFVVVQGVLGRQDIKTEKRANEIAEELNKYVDKEQKIPSSLKDAGISNVPATISYTKKDTKSYEFCVTYKAASGGSITDLPGIATGAALGSLAQDSAAYQESPDYKPSYLYINPVHKKGANCQVVEPYLYASDPYDPNDYCDPSNPDYDLYRVYCGEESSFEESEI